jgi:hypothetical protein
MITRADLQSLWELLCRDRDDPLARCALADAFEEAGEQDAADCLRWCAARHKRPHREDESMHVWWSDVNAAMLVSEKRYAWVPVALVEDMWSCQRKDGWAVSADGIWSRRPNAEQDVPWWAEYDTAEGAWLDLIAAWKAARRQGWTPKEQETTG